MGAANAPQTEVNIMLKIDSISGGYNGAVKVINFSADFSSGTITSILGRNGCGKSTILKLCAGLLKPFCGTISVDSVDLNTGSRTERAQIIGYLPQSRDVPDISVETLVLHGRFPHIGYPRVYREADRKIVGEALKKAGIGMLTKANLQEISGGERQKAYVAMLLAQETQILLIDEPTNNLDITAQAEFAALMSEMRKLNKIVILVTHDIALAKSLSDRLLVMDSGKIVADVPPNDANSVIERVFAIKQVRV
jgi:iron complex transport system ATP-binding protein